MLPSLIFQLVSHVQLQDIITWILLGFGGVKGGSSHALLNTTKFLTIQLKNSWSQAILERCLQRTNKHADGLAAEPVPGLQHEYSLQAMPLARWFLLTVFFSVQTAELQREVLPSPEQNQSKLATDLIFKELKSIEKSRPKLWDLLSISQTTRLWGCQDRGLRRLQCQYKHWGVQNTCCNRGMITVPPQLRYENAQPQVPELVLSMPETICNRLFGENCRTWYIICMCSVLIPLLHYSPWGKTWVNTQLEKEHILPCLCQKAIGREKGRKQNR